MTRSLCDVSLGEKVTISSISAPLPIKQRFMDMGLVKGSEVTIEKYAPLGNPIQITLKGYSLCLRKEDAKYIKVS